MRRTLKVLAACILVAMVITPSTASASAVSKFSHPKNFQETGFLNRTLQFRGAAYRFQVYLPDGFQRADHKKWPIILFLHGRGERGGEGMWQTQIGLPAAVRDHPERWPFIIVMPQCPQRHYWTDPDVMSMAMATLDQETNEFHADTARTYLTGLSLGGYGAWELARTYPKRWAAIAIAASGNEALDRALERPPDLIVLDIMLPGLDGLKVVPAVMETGVANVTCCQPEAVSLEKVAVLNSVPVFVQRLPVCVPVLPTPL